MMLICFPGGEKLKLVVKSLAQGHRRGDVLCPGSSLESLEQIASANSAAPHLPLSSSPACLHHGLEG